MVNQGQCKLYNYLGKLNNNKTFVKNSFIISRVFVKMIEDAYSSENVTEASKRSMFVSRVLPMIFLRSTFLHVKLCILVHVAYHIQH